MSRTILYIFSLTIVCIIANPILRDSLEFRIVDCIEGNNETSTRHILEIKNFNGTCVKINETQSGETNVYFYVLPTSEDGVQIHIKTENCSSQLPDVSLTKCDDDDSTYNDSIDTVTFAFSNISYVDPLDYNENINESAVTDVNWYTGPTIAETLHHLSDSDSDSDSDESSSTTTLSQDQIEQITQKYVEVEIEDDD